ncbi:MAG: DUF397 domain-containing protein [Clostridia bacterium]|jgi:hypothetical protein|nr:DUF397 domain-containing protein [Clostridia bacterium]
MNDLNWRKSTYSDGGGNCVEVAETASVTHVRDSKDIRIPGFTASNEAWTALVEYAKVQRV